MLSNYLIVHKSILPEYYEKVLACRRLMESGKFKEVSQAVKQVGISRSTYYKYKDYIFEPSDLNSSRKAVFSMMLDHAPGVLSALLFPSTSLMSRKVSIPSPAVFRQFPGLTTCACSP